MLGEGASLRTTVSKVEEKCLPEVTLEVVRAQKSPLQWDWPQHHRQREGSLHRVPICLSRLSSPTLRRGQKRGVEGTPCPHRGCWTGTSTCLSGFSLGPEAPGAEVTRSREIAKAGTSLNDHAQRICYMPLFLKWGKGNQEPATFLLVRGLFVHTVELHSHSPNFKIKSLALGQCRVLGHTPQPRNRGSPLANKQRGALPLQVGRNQHPVLLSGLSELVGASGSGPLTTIGKKVETLKDKHKENSVK